MGRAVTASLRTDGVELVGGASSCLPWSWVCGEGAEVGTAAPAAAAGATCLLLVMGRGGMTVLAVEERQAKTKKRRGSRPPRRASAIEHMEQRCLSGMRLQCLTILPRNTAGMIISISGALRGRAATERSEIRWHACQRLAVPRKQAETAARAELTERRRN